MSRKVYAGAVIGLMVVVIMAGAARAELLVHYNLDEAGGFTANDASGNGHTATYGGPGYQPQVVWSTSNKPSLSVPNISSARLTDNINTLITPDSDDLDGLLSFSVMVWVLNKPHNDSGYPILVWKNDRPGGDHAGFVVNWSNTSEGGRRLELTVGGDGVSSLHGTSSADVAPAELPNGWHHWAATYDGSTTQNNVAFYLDGNLISTGTVNQGRALTNDLDMYIGCRGDVADRAQRELMDEFRLYGSALDNSGALSQAQIQDVMVGIPEPISLVLLLGGSLIALRRK